MKFELICTQENKHSLHTERPVILYNDFTIRLLTSYGVKKS